MPDTTGVRAVTNAVISPNVEFIIGQFTIGYIRRLTETQARPVAPIYEVGTVGIVEMAPGQPAPITLSAEKVEIYGAPLINVIAKAIASGDLAGVSKAAGLSLDDTKTALKQWLNKRLGTDDFGQVFSLQDFPVGFVLKAHEQHPLDETKVMITTYDNVWCTRSSRAVAASGDLLVIGTAEMVCRGGTTTESIPVTQDKIEVVSKA